MAIPRIVAIGTASQDVFLSSPIFKPHKLGHTLEEKFPLGSKLAIEELTFSTGGNAMNAAVTFARQGLISEFIGLLGTEPAAQAITAELKDEGIVTDHLIQHPNYHTSYSTILLSPSGERTILNYAGTRFGEQGSDLNLSVLDHANWLYLSSVKNMAFLHQIVHYAATKEIKVALNPAGAELEEKDQLSAILKEVNLLIVNKEEAEQLVDSTVPSEFINKLTTLVPIVVVTDGPRGAVIADSQQLISAGVYKDVPAVDRTGAGDAFGSGIVAMLALGKTFEEAITFASANSTSVVGKIGATAGILHAHEPIHSMDLTVHSRHVRVS